MEVSSWGGVGIPGDLDATWWSVLIGCGVVVLGVVVARRIRAFSEREPEQPPPPPPPTPPPTGTKSGWLPDPDDPNLLRYYDGRVWTNRIRTRRRVD